jgi:hypothetical protein
VDAAEPGLLIQAARCVQVALRPQRDPGVAGLPREPDALVDEPPADAEPARLGLDQEQPKFGDGLRLPDEEHRADDGAVALGDPAMLPCRIEVIEKVGANPRGQSLELRVVAPLARVEHRVAVDDPAHVPRLVRAEQIGRRAMGVGRRRGEHLRDRFHRIDQLCWSGSGSAEDDSTAPRARASTGARAARPFRVRRSRLWRASAEEGVRPTSPCDSNRCRMRLR